MANTKLTHIEALDAVRARKGRRKTDDEEKTTQAQNLIKLADKISLFHTPEADCFATITINKHEETFPIKSKFFRRWLVRRFYEVYGKPPGAQALQDTLGILEAKAQFDGPEHGICNRIAETEDAVYIDLCNDNWEAVKVTAGGWEVINNAPVKFKRTRGMLPLPRPERGGKIEELKKFVNIDKENDWRLLCSWAVAALRPQGPYPVLVLQGEQGSAKSTTARVLRELIDPSTAPLRTTPKEERDLAITASNSWVLSFDNLSGMRAWLSDALCRVATGGGFTTRALFTDSEETFFNYVRPIIINGIDEIITRHDLLDRSLILNLPVIPEEERKSEDQFWQKFKERKPYILGAFLDIISVGLKNISDVKLSKLPRMADFAKWITACESALPWAAGGFMEVYDAKRAEAVDLALEADAVAQAVKILLERRNYWEGTATNLLSDLTEITTDQTTRLKSWPKTSRTLGNRIRRAATFLRQAGIEVNFAREAGGNRRRVIRISRENTVPNVPNVPDDENSLINAGL